MNCEPWKATFGCHCYRNRDLISTSIGIWIMGFLTHIFTILHMCRPEGSTGASSWKKTQTTPSCYRQVPTEHPKYSIFLCTPTVGTKEFVWVGKSSETKMLSKIQNQRVARSMSSGATWLVCVLLEEWAKGPHPAISQSSFIFLI